MSFIWLLRAVGSKATCQLVHDMQLEDAAGAFPAGSLVVLAGQGMGHRTDQLLPGSLAFGSEILGEVGGQDDDQDVTQELGGQEHPRVSNAQEPADPHARVRVRPREAFGRSVGLKISLEPFLR